MNGMRLSAVFFLLPTYWVVAIVALLPSDCTAAPPPPVAPVGTPVDTERFSKAKLTFQDEKVKDGKLILESQKEYKYSGSFQIAEMDDETDEYISNRRIGQTLTLKFIIDGEKSGYAPNADGTPAGEIITGSGPIEDPRIDASNVLRFEGKVKAPRRAGEHELRLAILPEGANKRVYILTRLVEVVAPKTPNGT